MWMAVISGWRESVAFSEDEEKAKKLAVKYKKRYCKDDLNKWNWEACEEYYGAYTRQVKEGSVIFDGDIMK